MTRKGKSLAYLLPVKHAFDRVLGWIVVGGLALLRRINRQRMASVLGRFMQIVGPWLPEPVVCEPGPEERAELADSLTLGFLTMLDRLDPIDRAVFLMADVFAVPYADIASAVDKSPAACRQIASRARRSALRCCSPVPPRDH